MKGWIRLENISLDNDYWWIRTSNISTVTRNLDGHSTVSLVGAEEDDCIEVKEPLDVIMDLIEEAEK